MTTENRFETMREAEARAAELTETTGEQHVAYKSNFCWNPYVAARLPQIGDEVSMGFNGDYYPVGKVVKISKTYSKITVAKDDGFTRRFSRVGPVNWKLGGKKGAFSLILGVIDQRNPHF